MQYLFNLFVCVLCMLHVCNSVLSVCLCTCECACALIKCNTCNTITEDSPGVGVVGTKARYEDEPSYPSKPSEDHSGD